jgi:hypothetical protein
MENDYDMSDKTYSIKPYPSRKRVHTQLAPMESNGLEREIKRFKYASKGSMMNNEKKISPVLVLGQTSNDMDVEMNYGPSRQEMYKR